MGGPPGFVWEGLTASIPISSMNQETPVQILQAFVRDMRPEEPLWKHVWCQAAQESPTRSLVETLSSAFFSQKKIPHFGKIK